MIIKTLFLASFVIACALASKDGPYPAALLVESNFDFSLIRQEMRVHYGGPRAGSTTIPSEVSIKIYGSEDEAKFTYNLKADEIQKSEAFHFALDDLQTGKYEVAVCEGNECSARTPSLTDFSITFGQHKLLCKSENSQKEREVLFVEPTNADWAEASDYTKFSKTINKARTAAAAGTGAGAAATEEYKTDYEKHKMDGNPYYNKKEKIFHIAIKHNLTNYETFFENRNLNDYCGRKYMLSVHSHVVDKASKKVVGRFKTVNHLSDAGKRLFIFGSGGLILLESTQVEVDIPTETDKTYQVWVSLCVTDKDSIEATYCARPIKKDLTIKEE